MMTLGSSSSPERDTSAKMRRPKTAAEAMGIEKRKAKNQLVESHLIAQPVANVIDAFLNQREISQEKQVFNKIVAENSNYMLKPYDPKYDDEEYIKEIIKKDTGHVIALKTEAKLPNKVQASKNKADSIKAKDLEEMKANKVNLPRYVTQMAEVIKASGILPNKNPEDWQELVDDLGMVTKAKQGFANLLGNKVDKERAKSVKKLAKDSLTLVKARADDEIWEKEDPHRLSRIEDVAEAPEEPPAKNKPVGKEDFFDEIAMGVEIANQEVGDNDLPPPKKEKSKPVVEKIDKAEVDQEIEAADIENKEKSEIPNEENESDFENLDGDPEEENAGDDEMKIKNEKTKTQKFDDLEDLPINSDIDPRFLDDYEFKYTKEKPSEPIKSTGPLPEPIYPVKIPVIKPAKTSVEIILEEMHNKRSLIQSKYITQEGDLEEKLRLMREKEKELKKLWDMQREREENLKKESEKKIYEENRGDPFSAHQRIVMSYDRISNIKNSIVNQDIHKAIEDKKIQDKINGRFKHLEILMPKDSSTNPLQNAKDRMKSMLDQAEKKIEKEIDENKKVTGAPNPKNVQSPKKPEAEIISKKKPNNEKGKTAVVKPVEPIPQPGLSEEAKKLIRDRLIKPQLEPNHYSHPWIDFD